jgi:ferric-dicitrate binding protein FerR (iron transport regulator)
MRWARPVLAGIALAGALLALVVAHDARSWQSSFSRGDARYVDRPAAARWSAKAWLPGDAVARLLRTRDDVALRRAIQRFVEVGRIPPGPENVGRRALARASAEVALADVAAHGSPASASQAHDLLGVLVGSAGRVAGGLTAEERSRAAFEAAVRADPSNTAAKYNLELLLRRSRTIGVRQGPGSGSGPSTGGRRGAGSGTPGRGY